MEYEKSIHSDKANDVDDVAPQAVSAPPSTKHDVEFGIQDNASDLDVIPTTSVNNIKSVPNGGLRAWLQVLGAFFIFFNSWGIINTFGTYQTYYQSNFLSTQTPSNISWIGSVQGTLVLLIGAITGPVYDAGYTYELLVTGSVLVVLGQMMLSLCHAYWQVMLAQAVCIGVGAGCIFVPGVAILSTYFSTRLSTAVGLAASGSSLGGVIYPIVLYRLIPGLGFAWATRVLGFMMLGTLLITNAVMRVRVHPTARRRILDPAAFREAPYALFVAGMTLGFVGLYAPFFYAESYALALGVRPDLAFYLLAIINSISGFGRVVPNVIADRVGVLNVLVPCTVVSAAVCLGLMATRGLAGLLVCLLLYGFFAGCFVSIPPPVFVSITADRALIGTRIGQGFTVMSLGLLTGTPICGAILNATGDFRYVWLFSGLMLVAGGVLITSARFAKSKGALFKKV